MAELADAQDLGSCALRRMGSSPTDRNRFQSVDGFLKKKLLICLPLWHPVFLKRRRSLVCFLLFPWRKAFVK